MIAGSESISPLSTIIIIIIIRRRRRRRRRSLGGRV
jgi:hypothetical protein